MEDMKTISGRTLNGYAINKTEGAVKFDNELVKYWFETQTKHWDRIEPNPTLWALATMNKSCWFNKTIIWRFPSEHCLCKWKRDRVLEVGKSLINTDQVGTKNDRSKDFWELFAQIIELQIIKLNYSTNYRFVGSQIAHKNTEISIKKINKLLFNAVID